MTVITARCSESPCTLLVIDTLFFDEKQVSHFSLPEALEVVRPIRPIRTLLVGVSERLDHDEMNAQLSKLLTEENLDVQVAYDGLCLDLLL
jgi:phosphoribosyl 1,2-cyclic phosphodiesterase